MKSSIILIHSSSPVEFKGWCYCSV